MKKNNKGFTLMEMLIVVAIIGILVAIAIPTVNKSLDKANIAADNANIRTAMAEVNANYLLGEAETKLTKEVGPMKASWDRTTFKDVVGDSYTGWSAGQYVSVSVSTAEGTAGTISIGAGVTKTTGGGTTTQPQGGGDS